MKDYYQYQNNGYKLPKEIYAKTVKTIRAYGYYKGVINAIENKSEIREKDMNNKVTAEMYVSCIEAALEKYVAREFRGAAFDHVARGIEYPELEMIYYLTTSSMKRWVQRFVYGVAVELGEDYEN